MLFKKYQKYTFYQKIINIRFYIHFVKKKTFPANSTSLHMVRQHVILLRTDSILVFQQRYRLFFSIINLITRTYETKKIYYKHQALFYISSTWEKRKNKLKQSEIEVKMIIKLKKNIIRAQIG